MTAVPPDVEVGELAGLLAEGAYVLDVREPYEYEEGHVPGAVLVPMGTIPAEQEQIPRDQPVYVVCAVGGRSARVAEYLTGLGVEAYNVAGGTQAWAAAGLPVVTGGEPT